MIVQGVPQPILPLSSADTLTPIFAVLTLREFNHEKKDEENALLQICLKLDNSVIGVSSILIKKYNEIIKRVFCSFGKHFFHNI